MIVTGWVSTWKVGSKEEFEVEIFDEDLEGLSNEERNRVIDDAVREEMFQHIEWGWNEGAKD